MNDLISKQAAIANYQHVCRTVKCGDCPFRIEDGKFTDCRLEKFLRELPSAEPEQRWIPVKSRPMDEEEKRYWEEHYGYAFGEDYDGIMFDCLMPEDGQEIWVCSKCGNVWQDTCEVDEGIGLEGNGDWDDIVAWMPFERPEPWKGGE